MNDITRERLRLPYCTSCMERHLGLCPPHEVRTTGVAWYRERIKDLEGECELLREEYEGEEFEQHSLIDGD